MTGTGRNGARRVAVLGNCVANRLSFLLTLHPDFAPAYELVPLPMIHTLRGNAGELDAAARTALRCDVVFSQPLFDFGPCNTDALRTVCARGREFFVFPTPNFEAYFPDVVFPGLPDKLHFAPPFDWHSSIVLACRLQGIDISEVEKLYLNHPLFREKTVRPGVERALENCAKRDRGVDLPLYPFIEEHYAETRLFYSWLHPCEELLNHMLNGMFRCMGLPVPATPLAGKEHGFGFNRWPLPIRAHSVFRFAEQTYVLIAGKRCSIEDTAMSYYMFYDFHPDVPERYRHNAGLG
ncbi:MAG: hypothetical protein LBC55_06800 [Desulfovibrio sp.]|jgi:hypothetical protein|nr:hypothetical protein [Desulfovibrio sp.]